MSGINKVILIGNLGADPDIKRFPDGGALCTLSVATSESWIDSRTGEKQERTDWHRVVLTSKLVGIAERFLRKGAKIYIEGQLKTRKWSGTDGVDRYTTEVLVGVTGTLQMLDSKRDAEDYSGGATDQYASDDGPMPF